MAREVTEEEKQYAQELLQRARCAMRAIENYDQAAIDRLCQAVAWATANEQTATRLAHMGVDESGLGDRDGRPNKRFKILGILRDALRQKSMGIIEEIPEKGLVKYAKPAGVIASVVPVTNAALTEPGNGIYALKCKDAIIFSPHPASKKTTIETVRIMRACLKKYGAPEDIFQCIERPSIPLAQELMAICDLTIATGGSAMVRAAYSSGKPAYGVGAGNATMVIDETANIEEAARNTRLSKTSDFGSGCSADGNLVVEASIYGRFLEQLQREHGYLVTEPEKQRLQAAMWDAEGHRTNNTIARPAHQIAEIAGFRIPEGKKFLIVEETSHRQGAPVLQRETFTGAGDFPLRRIPECAGDGQADLRGRRQGALLRHLLVQRRSHSSTGAHRAGQPHDGAPAPVESQCRGFQQWDADDVQHGLRRLGWKHHQ